MKEEVFVVLSENGWLNIERERSLNGDKFICKYTEVSDLNQKLHKIKSSEFNSFEEAFEFLNLNYPWYKLWVENVDRDYRNFVKNELVDVLNSKKINPIEFKDSLEIWNSTLRTRLAV